MTEIVVALIGLFGALVATGFGFFQWRRTHQAATAAPKPKPPVRLTRTEEKTLGRRRVGLLDRLTDDMRHISLLNRPKPLNIESLYVQLRVHDQQPLRFMHREELQELRGRELDDLITLTRARKKEHQAEILTPEDALARFRRIVVLGDPGAGKTTMLRYLGFKSATDEILPVFVELRRLVRAEGGLLDHVRQRWEERYGEQDADGLVDHALAAGTAVLLIDGLDEVLGGESADEADATYRRVVQEVDRLAARYPNARIAVTCRRAGWRGQLPAFRTLEVLDFDDSQIETFIRNWFADNPDKARKLSAALGRSSRIHTLSANPLLLSLIAIVFESDLELPERRSKLYARTIEVLLTEWDAKRDIKRFPRFTADRKRDLLEEIAWHFQRQGLAYFPRDELLAMIADFLPSIDLDPGESAAILDEIVEHYGLLKEQAHEVYGFLHLTIQEYFAAEVAARIGAPAIAEISAVRHDPWWEEVILLLAGRLHDATPLLLALLGHAQDSPEVTGPLAADDDLFHGDLLLAARCLGSTPRVKAPWLRARIVEELGEVMLTTPVESLAEQVTELFAEVGTSGLAAIESRLNELGPDRLEVLTEALGLFADGDEPVPVKEFNAAVKDVDLTHETSAPLIMEWMERLAPNVAHEGGVAPLARLAEAAGTLGLASAIPLLWQVHDLALEHTHADDVLHDARAALVRLGEIDIEELWELAAHNSHAFDLRLSETLVSLSAPTRVLAGITDHRLSPRVVTRFTYELRTNCTDDLAAPILTLLNDATIPWPNRWRLAEILKTIDAGSDLLKVMEDHQVHPMVRLGVAATLAAHGNHEGVAFLLARLSNGAIETRARDPLNRLAYIDPYFDPRFHVYSALARSEDPHAIATLLARFDHLVAVKPPTPREPLLSYECDTLVSALAATAGEQITLRLVNLLEGLPTFVHLVPFNNLVRSIAQVVPSSLTAEILRRIREITLPATATVSISTLLNRVSAVGQDKATAYELVKIINDPGSLWDQDLARDALCQVCKKAGVRVYPDGRVE
ncbi:NACHT domain-containing protein [Nonomuraea longicatena]|uniref:NACHT domain-containing protein n=1 Tax=Nonomuraea longicatena TaxID=83682 RepID=A0ABP3ZTY7_9ACTN